jgi:hypothetical protein
MSRSGTQAPHTHSFSEIKSMFKHLVPVVALALIAGPAFAQSAAAPAPAAAPAAAAAPAEKAAAKSSTHKKHHHHHNKAKAADATAADTAPAK